MEKPTKPKKQNGRSRSFTSTGGGSGLASFLRSTVASFSSTSSTAPRGTNGGRSSFNHRNAFSGPIAVSIVPPEARRGGGGRRRQQPTSSSSSGYRTPEPSSPKVSCIGQIKRSKSKRVNPASCGKNGGACPLPPRPPAGSAGNRPNKGASALVKRVLFRRSRSRRSGSSKSRDDAAFSSVARSGRGRKGKGAVPTAPAPDSAPAPAPAGGIGQMRRFTSGRAAFQDFDWQEEVAESWSVQHDGEEEDEGFVAHSAPLVLGGGVVASEPKKEVNLWRRRPIAAPTPLQLPY